MTNGCGIGSAKFLLISPGEKYYYLSVMAVIWLNITLIASKVDWYLADLKLAQTRNVGLRNLTHVAWLSIVQCWRRSTSSAVYMHCSSYVVAVIYDDCPSGLKVLTMRRRSPRWDTVSQWRTCWMRWRRLAVLPLATRRSSHTTDYRSITLHLLASKRIIIIILETRMSSRVDTVFPLGTL